jgi:hypothetical protein
LLSRVTAEADQSGFLRMQGQVEQAHAILEIIKERARLVLMLEADDRIVREADHDHIA